MTRTLQIALGALLASGVMLVALGQGRDAAAFVQPEQQTYMSASSPWSKDYEAPPPERAAVYFRNCDAARAAGAAPVRFGDAGYAAHLDRDGDGVGCEPYYGD